MPLWLERCLESVGGGDGGGRRGRETRVSPTSRSYEQCSLHPMLQHPPFRHSRDKAVDPSLHRLHCHHTCHRYHRHAAPMPRPTDYPQLRQAQPLLRTEYGAINNLFRKKREDAKEAF